MQDRVRGAGPGAGGRRLSPGDGDYERARGGWNLFYSHHPEVIVEARSVGDVVAAVEAAATTGARVAVQATGHGFTLPADQVLIRTGGIDHIEIDPASGSARLGAGVQWGPVLAAAAPHGLAPLLGSSPTVGAVGYTLGGGFGWLGRRHGLSLDRVRSFRVVIADGSVVTAAPDSHPELFWALRGGGHGSLGVVVEMEIDLVAVSEVYAGNLLYPIEAAGEVFQRYIGWSEANPEDFTSAFTVMNYPPIDDIPEPLRGRSFAQVRGCHCGDPETAQALVDEWRSWRAPAFDFFGRMPFAEIATVSQDPVDPVPAASSGRWLSHLDVEVGAALVDAARPQGGQSPVIIAETRHAGGAVARPPADTAYPVRTADRLVQVVALVPSPEAFADTERRLERLWGRLGERVVAPYLNFLEGEERAALGESGFDTATWRRLSQVKAAYDPRGMFAHGLQIATA